MNVMHIPTLMIIMALSMPQFALSQEAPLDSTSLEDQAPTEMAMESSDTESIEPTEQVTAQAVTTEDVPMIPGPPAEITATSEETDTTPTMKTENVSPFSSESIEEPRKVTESVSAETTEPEETAAIPTVPPVPSATQALGDMPEPVKEEPITIPEEPETQAPAGIDTVSLENPQGNWLYKRIWWERAEERYEKIRLLVDAVWESRTIFFVKRNELDRSVFDPFYLNVGIGQGELQTILTELVDFFEKHREQQGDLNEQERSLYDTIATEEEALKLLKQDIESIANLDHEIDNALGTLMNQINRVRQFERQAWENFKEIAHILNDTKARELYYMIEGAARNIKNISTYLEQDFFNHFTKLIDEATKHVNRVQNQIESLKEKGVSFKRQAELLEQTEQQPAEEEEEEIAPKPKLSWFGWIMSGISSVSDFIFSIIRMPYDMIFGK